MSNLIFDYTLITVLMGTGLVGITAGVLGCFAFLRKQSLLADAISHAALPGIALSFLCTQSKNPVVLLAGGAITGGIGTLLVLFITNRTSLKKDTALGLVLSVFFGLGLVLLTLIQKYSFANQAILNKFLFGNASTLLREEIVVMAFIAAMLMSAVIFFWKEFSMLAFDQEYTRALGYPVWLIDLILTILLVCSIVIGLQTVGVILMSTLFVAPAAAARQWTTVLRTMVVLAALFGAFSGMMGALLSSIIEHTPTGPAIVVVISSIVLVSIICAPHRGLLWQVPYIRRYILLQKNL
ncbi:MAG: iron chelate uptake ABC transporter family permease subunit [Candidatus Babeliales bacterium]